MKFRVVQINNGCEPGFEKYILQRRFLFFFWLTESLYNHGDLTPDEPRIFRSSGAAISWARENYRKRPSPRKVVDTFYI